MKEIFTVMNASYAVVKIRPENNLGLYRIWTHNLYDTSAINGLPTELTSQLGAGHYVGSK